MGKINWGRVVLGGLLAGVVLNVYNWVVDGLLLGAQWNAALQALGKGQMSGSIVGWLVVCDFLLGLWSVLLYAAIRPRFGPGPKTAAWAGLMAWFIFQGVTSLSAMPMGLFPANLFHVDLLTSLVMYPVAVLAGAALYQEA